MNFQLSISPSKEIAKHRRQRKKKCFDLGGNGTHILRISSTFVPFLRDKSASLTFTEEVTLSPPSLFALRDPCLQRYDDDDYYHYNDYFLCSDDME